MPYPSLQEPLAHEPLLILALVLTAGTCLGWVAQRIHLPSITGQILAGVLLGPSLLGAFDEPAVNQLEPITDFALALIGVTVGAHLNLHRLRNAGRRLGLLLLFEVALIPPLCIGALHFLVGVPPILALLLGPLALSTAPATIVAVVRETRARGVFVKTLIAAVAINNIACILLFEVAHSVAQLAATHELGAASMLDPVVLSALADPLSEVLLAISLGTAAALATHGVMLRVASPARLSTLSAISILLTFGIASAFDLSPLLAAMALGVVHANLNPARDRHVDSAFVNFEPAILCVFFTLAGLDLRFENAGRATAIALVFFGARTLGKLAASRFAMTLAHATRGVRENLGLALLPQAGVAIGLVILIENDPLLDATQSLFVATVLTSVTLSEILGPLATRIALGRAGEVGADRPRLVDFLQEENILIDLEADSMKEAIPKLVDFLITSHHLQRIDRAALTQSVLDREQQVSTCVGEGLAVPHGEIPEGMPMVGVMAISRRGLDFETPDGQPIHCIFLLATPEGQRDRHLAVLAALARKFGGDPVAQQQLYNARSAAHVYQILHEDEVDLNYYLDGASR